MGYDVFATPGSSGVTLPVSVANGGTGVTTAADAKSAVNVQIKATADVVRVTALPANTYNNGSSGINAYLQATANGALVVDGVAVAVNDIVLVVGEAAPANNGLYTVTVAGSGGAPYFLTRHTEMNQSAMFDGAVVAVSAGGTTYGNSLWVASPVGVVTVGTTAIPFGQIGGASYSAGANIDITANVISVSDTTGTGHVVLSSNPVLSAPTLGAASATTINGYQPVGLIFGSM